MLNVTITSSPNKRLVTVLFNNPGPEENNKVVAVKISNVDDMRLTKDETLVLICVNGQIFYRLHYSVVSSVDGVDPQSNQELFNLLFTIFDSTS